MLNKTKTNPTLRSLIALCALAASSVSADTRADTLVEGFDRAITSHLPSDAMSFAAGTLAVHGPLDVRITLSSGESKTIYRVTWQGEEAMAFRSADTLTITRNTPDRTVVTRANANGTIEESSRLHGMHPPLFGPIDKEPLPSPDPSRSVMSRLRSADATYGDLHLFVYVEDGIDYRDEQLATEHLVDWMEMAQTKIFPGITVNLTFRRGIAGVTNHFDVSESSLEAWVQRMNAYAPGDEAPQQGAPNRLNLFLVRGVAVAPNFAGMVDSIGGHYGIASINFGKWIVPHEIGHLLGATHELAEYRDEPTRRCKTIMYYEPSGCMDGWFSENNIKAMQQLEQDKGRFAP